MNLLENEDQIQRSKKGKVLMIIIAVVIVILLILCGVIAYQIGVIENSTLKLVIDGKSTTFDETLFITENDQLYINIKDFAELVGYHTYSGDFKEKYTEDSSNCYISSGSDVSTSDEVASYSLNSSTMYKQVQNQSSSHDDYDYEYYDLDLPVISKDNELYASEEGIEIGTNCLITYDTSSNTITVSTLDYISSAYATAFTSSTVNVDGDKALFNNIKALKNGLVVIVSDDGYYGVCDSQGNEIIGTKYSSIEYLESTNEFTVTTDSGLVGILSAEGETKIEPNYSEIKKISQDLSYYLVCTNNKYGVINQNGNTVIFAEYDQIGIDETDFPSNDIDNPYILFDYCIPVMQNDKWGIYSIYGEQLVALDYIGIGCVDGASKDIVSNNVVIIPQYEAIVMETEDEKFTILSALGETYVPAVLDAVYSVTSSGVDTYYMTFTIQQEQDGKTVDVQQTYNVDTYFTEQEIVTQTVESQTSTNTTTDNTTVDNTTTTETTVEDTTETTDEETTTTTTEENTTDDSTT